MNVVSNLLSNPSDTAKVSARQDRGGSSKQGSSGFSDTLGSFTKKADTSQAPSSGANASSSSSANSGSASRSSTSTSDSSQASSANNQPAAQPNAGAKPTGNVSTKSANAAPSLAVLPDAATLDVASMVTTDKASAPVAAPQPDIQMPTAPLDPNEIAGMADALSDLAKLVNALANGKSIEAPADATDAENATDDAADKDDNDTDTAVADDDLLSLLAASTLPKEQTVTAGNDVQGGQTAPAALAGASGAALRNDAMDAATATSPTVVRLTKEDAPSIDMHITPTEDGPAKVDISIASNANIDVVQVVENRRYLAVAPTTNAAAITSAMTSDTDWTSAMSGQTGSAPLVTSTGQVVHTLKIQMNPVELGHVTAALKLVGDELSVHLTAHTLKGYAELQKDGSSIMDALKAQGFSVDQVTVSVSTGSDRQDSTTANRQQGDMNQQGAQQGSQRGNESRSQEQFYRQSRPTAPGEMSSNDISVQPEALDRATGVRPDHLYL